MMKIIKKYIYLLPLLLVLLLPNVNADVVTATFDFKIVNHSDKNVAVHVFGPDMKDIVGKDLAPGEPYSAENVKVEDPSNSYYVVTAFEKPYSWVIAAGTMTGSQKMTKQAANEDNKNFMKDTNVDSSGSAKQLFQGYTANFDLQYDAATKKGTFNVTVEDKSKPGGVQGGKA